MSQYSLPRRETEFTSKTRRSIFVLIIALGTITIAAQVQCAQKSSSTPSASNTKSLEDAMKASIEELDGVFTYLVATSNSLGMAKDTMAAKPMVLYESDKFIALASEEVAIRSVFPHEINTFDPYEGEVRVWNN